MMSNTSINQSINLSLSLSITLRGSVGGGGIKGRHRAMKNVPAGMNSRTTLMPQPGTLARNYIKVVGKHTLESQAGEGAIGGRGGVEEVGGGRGGGVGGCSSYLQTSVVTEGVYSLPRPKVEKGKWIDRPTDEKSRIICVEIAKALTVVKKNHTLHL